MIVYDRENQCLIDEFEYQKRLLGFLYETLPGRVLLKSVVARPWVSKVQGKYYNSKRSKRKVEPFVEKYGIDISHWNIDDFKCFNDF